MLRALSKLEHRTLASFSTLHLSRSNAPKMIDVAGQIDREGLPAAVEFGESAGAVARCPAPPARRCYAGSGISSRRSRSPTSQPK